MLPRTFWSLAYCEAVRRGDERAERALERSLATDALEREELRRFARGEPDASEPLGVPLEVRAAALLVRSRNPQLHESDRRALRKRALEDDVIAGPVTVAAEAWGP